MPWNHQPFGALRVSLVCLCASSPHASLIRAAAEFHHKAKADGQDIYRRSADPPVALQGTPVLFVQKSLCKGNVAVPTAHARKYIQTVGSVKCVCKGVGWCAGWMRVRVCK